MHNQFYLTQVFYLYYRPEVSSADFDLLVKMAVHHNSSTSSICFFLHITRYEEQRNYVIVTIVLNALLFIPNVLGSALILVTMWKNPNLELPNHVYLTSLALADLITGLIVQPLYVVHKTAWLYNSLSLDCVCRVMTEIVAWISAAVSCSSIGLISLDRMLAIKLHLKYQFYVTRKRAVQVTAYLWVSLVLLSFSRFLMENICPFVIFGVIGILLGILQVLGAYLQIYKYMRHHQKKIAFQAAPASFVTASSTNDPQHPGKTVKLKTLWKSAMNLGYVVGLYVIVYLPFVASLIAFLIHGQTLIADTSYDLTRTLIFCAGVLNPLVYCWKIKDIKVEVMKTLARMKCRRHGPQGGMDIPSNDSNINIEPPKSFTTEFPNVEN